jgi:hypothetical protein
MPHETRSRSGSPGLLYYYKLCFIARASFIFIFFSGLWACLELSLYRPRGCLVSTRINNWIIIIIIIIPTFWTFSVKSGPIGFAVCPHATGRDELNGVSWNLTLIVSKRADTVQLRLQLLLCLFLFLLCFRAIKMSHVSSWCYLKYYCTVAYESFLFLSTNTYVSKYDTAAYHNVTILAEHTTQEYSCFISYCVTETISWPTICNRIQRRKLH